MVLNYNVIKQQFIDMFQQTCYAGIINTPCLETYCLFKHSFAHESYLDFIQDMKLRKALTKFQISYQELVIEIG